MRKPISLVVALCLFFVQFASATTPSSENQTSKSMDEALTSTLTSLQATGPLPGFCVAVVRANGSRYVNGFGYADIAAKRRYGANTVQPVASISKTFIGISLMQEVEAGLVSLDAPIGKYLPFKIVNPRFPTAPITLRQLATHTSGIVDRQPFYDHTYIHGDQTAFDLKDFLAAYLAPGGTSYQGSNFGSGPPGTRFEYSNIAASLAAYIVGVRQGQLYATYVQTHILKPLHMDSSYWSRRDVKGPVATLYDQSGRVIAPYTFPTYADGGLFTSCTDLSKFLAEVIRGYSGHGVLLTPSAYREMLKPQFAAGHRPKNMSADDEPNQGIFWQYSRSGLIGHSGGDPGVDSHMFFDLGTGVGRILITNMSGDGDRQDVGAELDSIWAALGEYGEKTLPTHHAQSDRPH